MTIGDVIDVRRYGVECRRRDSRVWLIVFHGLWLYWYAWMRKCEGVGWIEILADPRTEHRRWVHALRMANKKIMHARTKRERERNLRLIVKGWFFLSKITSCFESCSPGQDYNVENIAIYFDRTSYSPFTIVAYKLRRRRYISLFIYENRIMRYDDTCYTAAKWCTQSKNICSRKYSCLHGTLTCREKKSFPPRILSNCVCFIA